MPLPKTYANDGACRRAAKAFVTQQNPAIESPVRGEHFQMALQDDGRWRFWVLPAGVQQENPEDALKREAERRAEVDSKAQVVRDDGMTREAWLREAVVRMHEELFMPLLAEHEVEPALPRHRVSCGFPAGARPSQQKGGAVGSCHYPEASADGSHEIFISPVLGNPDRVLDVLAHEMCHMYLGQEAKHGPRFKALATAIGLTGKMTATVAGERFIESTAGMPADMGPYPHAELGGSVLKPKNPVRQVPVFCDDQEECKLTFRIAKKYIDANGGDSVSQSPTSDLTCPACGNSTHIKWPEDRTQ